MGRDSRCGPILEAVHMITLLGWYMFISLSWVVSLIFGNYCVKPEDKANPLQLGVMCLAGFAVWPVLITWMGIAAVQGNLNKKKGR